MGYLGNNRGIKVPIFQHIIFANNIIYIVLFGIIFWLHFCSSAEKVLSK